MGSIMELPEENHYANSVLLANQITSIDNLVDKDLVNLLHFIKKFPEPTK